MTTPADDPAARLRRSVYVLLIAVSAGAMLGRILAVDDVPQNAIQEHVIRGRLDQMRKTLREKGLADGDPRMEERLGQEEARLRQLVRYRRPFLSANDRSRWCTLRALVEKEMRVPGAPYAIDRVIQEPTWDTIDMVKHDGRLYSSKPPLFPTLAAIPYWLVYHTTGATLGSHPYAVGRFMLVLINVIPLVICLLLVARLVERFGTTDWGRIFVMSAAAFGTFLTTFAVVFNNHLPAAVSAAVALYASVRIWFDGEKRLAYFAIAGLFAALAAACELPALALLAALSAALAWKAPRQTLLAYAPAVLVVAAGFFGTNWIAHHSLRPPYMHRSKTDPADNWYHYTYLRNGKPYTSYWQNRVGIDRGEPSPGVYALHVLVGHHGIFSLTPVWILTLVGLGMLLKEDLKELYRWMMRSRPRSRPAIVGAQQDPFAVPATRISGSGDRRLRKLALMIAAISLVCLLFYLIRPQHDRNYGGMTSAFRWMFWFAPLWLVAMLPAADWAARRKWTRAVALVLLALSILSAAYPTWNPWTHPWILDWLHHLGWIKV